MKIKKYIMQSLLPLFAAGWLFTSILSCTEEDVPNNAAPVLTIQDVNNLFRTSVTLSGSISGETNRLKDFGFDYSTSEAFPSDKTIKVSMMTSGPTSTLTTTVKNLAPNERYYYRMYATTGVSTIYSQYQQFQTSSMSAPQISQMTSDTIGENYARFRFAIEDKGNEVLIECGVSYKKSDSKTFIPIASETITANDEYIIELTDLEPDTEYDFRPYAKNAADADASTGSIEGYGSIVKQKTAALLSADVETGIVDDGDIKITSVKMTGTILSAVGSKGVITECGFVYSNTSKLPTYNSDSKIIHKKADINVGASKYSYSEDVIALSQATHYYVRAYARNTVNGEERIAYGIAREVTTKQLSKPILDFNKNIDGSTNITSTATTITLNATITNYDANALVEKGVIWSRTQGDLSLADAKKNNTFKAVTNGENQIVVTIEGLEVGVSYYIRPYAIFKSADITETGYTGYAMQTWTAGFQLPNLELEVNNDKVTFNSAEFTGKISNSGNTNITERGFVLSSSTPEVTLENCDKSIKSDDKFVSTATALKRQTTYYARAYTKCELAGRKETIYSSWINFYTKDISQPTFSRLEQKETTLTSITVESIITPGNDGTIIARGFCARTNDGNYQDPTIEDTKIEEKVTSASNNTYTLKLDGLQFNTGHNVRAYAIVQIGDEKYVCYANNTYWFQTGSLNLSLTTTPADTYCEVTAQVQNKVDLSDVEYGFVWTNNGDINMEDATNKLKCTNIDSDYKYSGKIDKLTPGKKYYLSAYVTIGGKTIFYNHTEFTTKRTPGQEDNVSPDKKQ